MPLRTEFVFAIHWIALRILQSHLFFIFLTAVKKSFCITKTFFFDSSKINLIVIDKAYYTYLVTFHNWTSNASHCIGIWIYGIFELGPLLKRIVIDMVLSPTDELWLGFESRLSTTVIRKGQDLKILILFYSLQVQ